MDKKVKVKRIPKRGYYDQETIYRILDQGIICHVGFVYDDYPVVIPTMYGRVEDVLYLHGSAASRMINSLAKGIDTCITVTTIQGLVLAKSLFHHSMNYESVVLFGRAEVVKDDEEKMVGLKAFTEHIIPGRWYEARIPNGKELKGTSVLKFKIENASAKIRCGGANDDKTDQDLPIWTGVLPIHYTIGSPVLNDEHLPIPESVKKLIQF